MKSQLIWVDFDPYFSRLLEVAPDRPFNRKVAEITYNFETKTWTSWVYADSSQIDLADKQEAMEYALAKLVLKRFDQAT